VVHYGIDTNKFKPAAQAARGNYVLSAGAITPHKAFGFLVESLGTISASLRPPLWIASAHVEQEELRRLNVLAHNYGVILKIVHPQSDDELVSLYTGAQAFLFAARHEAFGLVVLEAMACGTPVIGVEDGGYAESIVPGVTGFITPRSADAFGEAIVKLLENPKMRRDMGQCAREHMCAYWTWNCTVDALEEYLFAVSVRRSVGI